MRNIVLMAIIMLFAATAFAQVGPIPPGMQEQYGAFYQNAAGTYVIEVKYDKAAAANVVLGVGASGATLEIKVNGTAHEDIAFPTGSDEITLATFWSDDKYTDMKDLADFIDSSADFSARVYEHFPPWMSKAANLKAGTVEVSATDYTKVGSDQIITRRVEGLRNRTILTRGHKVYATFGSGTGFFDIFEYSSSAGETRLFRNPLATTTAVERKNHEFRLDATTANDVYYVIDLSTQTPNAANDYIIGNYSIYRR